MEFQIEANNSKKFPLQFNFTTYWANWMMKIFVTEKFRICSIITYYKLHELKKNVDRDKTKNQKMMKKTLKF